MTVPQVLEFVAGSGVTNAPEILSVIPPHWIGLALLSVVGAWWLYRELWGGWPEALNKGLFPLVPAGLAALGSYVFWYRPNDEVFINLEHSYNFWHHGIFSSNPVHLNDGTVEFVYYLLHTPFAFDRYALVQGNYAIGAVLGLLHLVVLHNLLRRLGIVNFLPALLWVAVFWPLWRQLASGFGAPALSLAFLVGFAAILERSPRKLGFAVLVLPLLRPDGIAPAFMLIGVAALYWDNWRYPIRLLVLTLFATGIYYLGVHWYYGHWVPVPMAFKSPSIGSLLTQMTLRVNEVLYFLADPMGILATMALAWAFFMRRRLFAERRHSLLILPFLLLPYAWLFGFRYGVPLLVCLAVIPVLRFAEFRTASDALGFGGHDVVQAPIGVSAWAILTGFLAFFGWVAYGFWNMFAGNVFLLAAVISAFAGPAIFRFHAASPHAGAEWRRFRPGLVAAGVGLIWLTYYGAELRAFGEQSVPVGAGDVAASTRNRVNALGAGGALLGRVIPPSWRFGITEMNTFGFMNDRDVIDLWGYTNPAIAHSRYRSPVGLKNNPDFFMIARPEIVWLRTADPRTKVHAHFYWWERPQGPEFELAILAFSRAFNLVGDMKRVLQSYSVYTLVHGAYRTIGLVRNDVREDLTSALLASGFGLGGVRPFDMPAFDAVYNASAKAAHFTPEFAKCRSFLGRTRQMRCWSISH